MSALTSDQVKKVAHLARLAISEEEIATHIRNLSNILELVDQMDSVDTKGIAPMAHPLDIPTPVRPDQITECNQREQLQTVADENAVKSGLYMVPKAYE